MRKHIAFGALACTLLFSAGCARVHLSAAGLSNQVQVNPSSEPIKKHFEEDKWVHHFLFRLIPTAEPKIAEFISSHATSGEKIVGLQVKKETTFVNGLICVLVGFVYCPETWTLEGDVVSVASSTVQK